MTDVKPTTGDVQRCLYTGELITEQPLSQAAGGDKVRERLAVFLAN